jgi:bacteriorhodopsin
LLSSTQQTVLWIGCAGMGLGAIAIAALSQRAPRGQKHHFVMSFAVCALAFTAYYAMANGYGIVRIHGREEFFARYLDWFLTTPLLIGGLLMIGLPARSGAGEAARERLSLVAGVIGADMFMIVTGLAAGLIDDKPVKYGFYAISCIAFLIVLGVLWGPVRQAARAQGGPAEALYNRLTPILSVLWCIYPVLWILGTEGTKTLNLTGEIVVFAIIDLTAKVVFGLLLCTGILGQPRAVSATDPRPVAGVAA